jgi:glycosyltransferase involved in cell wall biosynthesis
MMSYLAITPARDEEKFLPGLIASMAGQTCVPARWIIIDDGSVDNTPAIIDDARAHVRGLSRNTSYATGRAPPVANH